MDLMSQKRRRSYSKETWYLPVRTLLSWILWAGETTWFLWFISFYIWSKATLFSCPMMTTKRPSRLNNKNSLISNKSKTRLPPNSWPKTVKKANVWSHSSMKSSKSNLMNNRIMINSSSTSLRFFSTSIRHPIKSMTGMRITWCKNQWRVPQTWRKRENRVIRLTQKCLTLKMLRTL